jgi:hypothetical protein
MVRKYMQSTRYAYGAACSSPVRYITNHLAYYYTKVNKQIFTGAFSSAVPEFFHNPEGFLQDMYLDTCTGFECNPSNCGRD